MSLSTTCRCHLSTKPNCGVSACERTLGRERAWPTQGKLMPGMLASMDIAFDILPDFEDGAQKVLKDAMNHIRNRRTPRAIYT